MRTWSTQVAPPTNPNYKMALALRTVLRRSAVLLTRNQSWQSLRCLTTEHPRQTPADSESSEPWCLGRLNHVAIAVPDLEAATRLYRDVLGASVSEVVPLPEHGVCTVFVELNNTKLELLHPLGEKSPIESFLKKKPGGGMHHICLEVDDIRQAIKSLEGKIRPLNSEPQIGAHGKPVVFLHPKDCGGVLIELEEA